MGFYSCELLSLSEVAVGDEGLESGGKERGGIRERGRGGRQEVDSREVSECSNFRNL